jgi:hypothetical protein
VLLNVLSHQADLRMLLTLETVRINVLPIVGFTNLANILFQPAIRPTSGLRGRRGLTRQRASSHRNIRKELRLLEGEALLLEELVVHGGLTRLIRLLLDLTSAHLRLTSAKSRLLSLSAKAGIRLTSARTHAIQSLPSSKAHVVQVLTRTTLLRVLLLTEGGKLVCRVLRCSTVGLSSTKVHALLLLKCVKRLTVVLLQKTRKSCLISHRLLTGKICLSNTTTVATKRARHNSLPAKSRPLLCRFLLLERLLCLNYILHVRRHVLFDGLAAELFSVYWAHASVDSALSLTAETPTNIQRASSQCLTLRVTSLHHWGALR